MCCGGGVCDVCKVAEAKLLMRVGGVGWAGSAGSSFNRDEMFDLLGSGWRAGGG
jgi:hypothetical protein